MRADLHARLHFQGKVIGEIIHREDQRIVGPLLRAQGFNTLPGLEHFLPGNLVRTRAVAVVQECAEQRRWRRHATAPLGQGQGGIFMTEQGAQPAMGAFHPVAHALRAHAHPQRQGVDEHAQCPAQALAGLHASQHHRAEHHLFTPRDAAQHLGPGQMEDACRADAELTRLHPHPAAEFRGQRLMVLFDGATVAQYILLAERQGRFVDIAQHLAEKRLVGLALTGLAGSRHIVAVGNGRLQLPGLPHQPGLHFALHDRQRGMIQRHVVEQQHRDPALVDRVFGAHQRQQRCLAEVQAIVARVETGLQLRQDIALGQLGADVRHAQSSLAPDHLERCLQVFADDGGAQDVMAIDHVLQGRDKILQALTAGDAEMRLQDIRIALEGGQVVIEDPFLQGRQGIDILHIGRAARHAGHDAINGRLIQRGQRQHFRRDPFAAGRDGVGGNLALTGLAGVILAAVDQFDQRGLVLAQQGQHLRLLQRLFPAPYNELIAVDR